MLSRRLIQSIPSSSRSYATKVSSTDSAGKISSLTIKVNAGSRYSSKDGLSHLLSRFNFQDTLQRSALRLTRESEFLGGEFYSTLDRDSIYLTAKFLKQDLPYYVNALGDVLYKTSFKTHELPEIVLPAIKYDLNVANANPFYQTNELLHSISFRKGLGNPLHYDGAEKVSLQDIKDFADKVYVKENVEIIGQGVNLNDLNRFVGESNLNQLPAGVSVLDKTAPKTYVGNEVRSRSSNESVAAIAIPVQEADFATYEVLSQYLTSPLYQSSPLVSKSILNKYSQVGLFTLFVKGQDASKVSSNIKKIVSDLKKGVKLSDAKAYASTKLAISNESALIPVELDFAKVDSFKLGKFNYAAFGDVRNLPFADEL